MRIYKMTATFGKLQNQTLTLKPDLNIIEAPNEWGKSTWCAFLVAMLYGISTGARTTKDSLAEKEHYAPWSGAPMSGSMDICWNGRDITIQRSSKGRSIFGQFQAFETHTGLPVPELTAENCGQKLLGVERGVFTRTGFLRLADLPVTDDAALRKRLNALVTTGDESGTEEKLLQTLKDLKNRCRHNKTGLLPQEEAKGAALQAKIDSMDSLQQRCAEIAQRQKVVETQLEALTLHQAHLAYQKGKQEQALLENARKEVTRLREKAEDLSVACASLPEAEATRYQLSQLGDLQQKWAVLQAKQAPFAPVPPQAPAPFAGLDGASAVEKATADTKTYGEQAQKPAPNYLIAAICFFLAGIGLSLVWPPLLVLFGILGGVCLTLHFKNKPAPLPAHGYGDLPMDKWLPLAEGYLQAENTYKIQRAAYEEALSRWEEEKAALSAALNALTSGRPVSLCLALWNAQLSKREELADVQKSYTQAKAHQAALASVVKEIAPPPQPDTLTYSAPETEQLLADLTNEQKTLQIRLSQWEGQLSALGDREATLRELATVRDKIARLEDYYGALTVALETAATAANALQRRFAPEISRKAQALFSRLTAGRYQKLTLSDDFTLQVSAQEETTLRGTLWRSDGTVDQLYLALRLAVAQVLTPNAPLVLDDALVRFDDVRLQEALTILQEEAAQKQVILFTCQGRENALLQA